MTASSFQHPVLVAGPSPAPPSAVWLPAQHLDVLWRQTTPASALVEEVVAAFGLEGCAQDELWHAEGDVATHTAAAFDAAAQFTVGLPEAVARLVATAVVLHDVGKPATSRLIDGRLRAPRHAPVGALLARKFLWERGWPAAEREFVCSLVASHTLPFHLLDQDRDRMFRSGVRVAHMVGWDAQLVVARCDVCGRVCDDPAALSDAAELAGEWASSEGLDGDVFASESSRVRFFDGRSAFGSMVPDVFKGSLTLMCGLPASGKSSWVDAHCSDSTVVSLDAIRAEFGFGHGVRPGVVLAAATARVREALAGGADVVLDATNLTRQRRSRWLQLAAAYGARSSIVVLDAPRRVLVARDAERTDRVSASVIDRLMGRFEFPDFTEAHSLSVVSSLR